MDFWTKRYANEGKVWGDTPTGGVKLFKPILKKKKVQSVLDLGCGYGRDSLFLVKNGFWVTGVDSSPKAIELAEELIEAELNVKFFEGNASQLSFPPKTFDAVWSANLVHLYKEEERAKLVQEIRKVLVNKGILGLYVCSVNDPKYGEGKEIEHNTFIPEGHHALHFFDVQELKSLLDDFGVIALKELKEHEIHSNGNEHDHAMWFVAAEKR